MPLLPQSPQFCNFSLHIPQITCPFSQEWIGEAGTSRQIVHSSAFSIDPCPSFNNNFQYLHRFKVIKKVAAMEKPTHLTYLIDFISPNHFCHLPPNTVSFGLTASSRLLFFFLILSPKFNYFPLVWFKYYTIVQLQSNTDQTLLINNVLLFPHSL